MTHDRPDDHPHDHPHDRPHDRPDVSVIIVSYNTRELTVACVRSVLAHTTGCTTEIIVVDNDSADGSADALRGAFPDITVIANRDNVGFATANNQGMAVAKGGWILLLNSDTELHDDAISASLEFARTRERLGVVGCRLFGLDGRQQSSLFRFLSLRELVVNLFVPNSVMRRSKALGFSRYAGVDRDRVLDVDAVAGAFMLLPREVYERAGGMDETFFMYGEEAEWCWRIRRRGYSIVYYPGARITHFGGASAKQDWASMTLSMAKGQVLFLRKTRAYPVAWLANAMMTLRDTPRWIVYTLLGLLPGARWRQARERLALSARRFPHHLAGLVGMGWLSAANHTRPRPAGGRP